MKIPFLAWLLQGIPEVICATYLMLSLITDNNNWKATVKIGLLLSVCTYFIRCLPFTPGVPVLLEITIMAIAVIVIEKAEIKKSVIGSAVVFAMLIIFEYLFISLLTKSGVVTEKQINENMHIRVLAGYPQILFMFIMTRLNNKFKLSKYAVDKILYKKEMMR
jgi:hypothetical protein